MHRMTIRLWRVRSLALQKADAVINVGVSGPGVVKKAIEQVRGKGFEELCEMIKKTAFKITRVGQLVAGEASETYWVFRLELSICLLHRLRQWVTVWLRSWKRSVWNV